MADNVPEVNPNAQAEVPVVCLKPDEECTKFQNDSALTTEQVSNKKEQLPDLHRDDTALTAEQVDNKKEQLPDLHQDPVGWVNHQTKAAVHKVNYHILKWIHDLVYTDESATKPALPGKDGFVTRNQFLDHLRDGTLLAELANKLHPGAIETVYKPDEAKDKNNQKTNIDAFLTFAKEKAEVASEQLFDLKDLQEKGKAGYQAVLSTLFHIGTTAQEKFNQIGLNVEEILKESFNAVEPSIITDILNFLKRANPSALRKSFSTSFSQIFGNPSTQPTDKAVAQTEGEGEIKSAEQPTSSAEESKEISVTTRADEKAEDNKVPQTEVGSTV